MAAKLKIQNRHKSQRRWRLTDAKARFSEVVKLARKQPQRVTVDGEDAVVIVAAVDYDREHGAVSGAELVKAFQYPLADDLEFERSRIVGTYRETEL